MAIEWLDTAKDAIDSIRSALSLFRDVQRTLPKGGQAEAIAKALDAAESKARLAEAQMAQALGYKLCQCTFPPQIMLLAGYDEEATFVNEAEFFECPRCGRQDPPERMRRRGLIY